MIKGGDQVSGRCHCGAVRFEARLSGGLEGALRCTCSLCRMRGAVVVFAQLGELRITQGAGLLTTYRFNTQAAKHHFCSVCGVYTHHQRRFDPNQYAINAACLEGVSPFDFDEVPVIDGVNHPLDNDGTLHVIGTLRFVRSGET
jgi:hypothetical protein